MIMEKIILDCGLKEYAIGNGVLSINAADFNMYERFAEVSERVVLLDAELTEKVKHATSGKDILRLYCETDRTVKELLQYAFGEHNDFDKIVCGVNMFAAANNGKRVIANLLNALAPILENGTESVKSGTVGAAERR